MNRSRLLFGGSILAVGVLLLLDNLGAIDDAGSVIGDWWPLFIIAAALLMLPTDRWQAPVVVGAIGVILLLSTTGVADISGDIIWPIVLIAIGIGLIVRQRPPRQVSDDRINAFTAFGGIEMASHSRAFTGGSVGAVFGGAEIDLRDAHLADGARMDVFTAFGGTEIFVPQGWKVVTRGLPLFGGFENATSKDSLPADAPVLDINATVLFGGLEVKH